MKLKEFLDVNTTKLSQASISTARLDLLVLLEDTLNINRTRLLAHLERDLTDVELTKLDSLITKRCQHWPLAYLRGKTEFYGREFAINSHVLEPRPESETMIDLLKNLVTNEKNLTIIDVGTGSGALAVSAKLELTSAKVFATDIDTNCVNLAKQNAKKHSANVRFFVGDLISPLPTFNGFENLILLCNLPYVPNNFKINKAAMKEPSKAIFGGEDGLDLYRKLFIQLKELDLKCLYILTEAMPPQHTDLLNLAKHNDYALLKVDDFIQVYKIA